MRLKSVNECESDDFESRRTEFQSRSNPGIKKSDKPVNRVPQTRVCIPCKFAIRLDYSIGIQDASLNKSFISWL